MGVSCVLTFVGVGEKKCTHSNIRKLGHIHEALVTALFDDASALTSADPDADHAHLIASASSGGGGSFSPTRGSREQIAALVSLAADILNFIEGRFISSEQEDVKRCLR